MRFAENCSPYLTHFEYIDIAFKAKKYKSDN